MTKAKFLELDFAKIAQEAGLIGRDRTLYVLYMAKRWGLSEIGKCYAEEWAERFKIGTAYACSDKAGQRILDMLNLIVQ